MPARLAGRLGPLAERDFRLLFSATTITTLGDRLAGIALVFAVLDFGSVTDLGLVLAARGVAETGLLVFGAVWSDRLPRNLVLTGAAMVQGAAQAATAFVVLAGTAGIGVVVVLQALYGVGGGFVVPAEVGLVPQTVNPSRLQQANALQGLSRNVVGILGPALGGAIVVAGSPGVALAVDAASFVVCAGLLSRIRVAGRVAGATRPSFFRELREGWSEFTAHTWLWSTVLLFGLGNLVFAAWWVLGPAIAKDELGGAGAWAAILTAGGVGSVVGGLVALRLRPSRPLLASCLAPAPLVLQPLLLALHAPVWALAGVSFVAGAGLSVHLTLWFTVFQREVPEQAQSRVSSYDALGSFALLPLGYAIVGPVADAIGVDATLLAAAAIETACLLTIVSIPAVWAIRAPEAEPAPV